MTYHYENDWREFAFSQADSEFASEETIRELFSCVTLGAEETSVSGIPLCAKDEEIIVNNETENTVIFGGTGAKKTRSCMMPLIVTLACAGESMILADVK